MLYALFVDDFFVSMAAHSGILHLAQKSAINAHFKNNDL